jgi:LacI family transcriptional regulator/LacI family repressor for deo operon, udp, cdd, tsx, nupC, and nupG
MSSSRRITQKDIARVAGVNPATVSMALRSHPSIPERTRKRILEIATKLGYTPDPLLTALVTYRHSQRASDYRGTLGWLCRTTKAFSWKMVPHFDPYFQAAQERAESHGYKIEIIDLCETGHSWKRASAVARARGINGILLCPQPQADTDIEDFDWDQFAAVTFGHSLRRPKLNLVAPAQYVGAFRTVSEMLARGYRRIGFAFGREQDQRTQHNYLAGYLAARQLHDPRGEDIPALIRDNIYTMREMVWEWIDKYKPDAVVTCDHFLDTHAPEHGLRVPDDIGMACPSLPNDTCSMAGVFENGRVVGASAIDLLVTMVHHGERGLPANPQQLLVEGAWIPGCTLCTPSRD